MISSALHQLQSFAVTCANDGSFFGFPTWYKYLPPGQAGGGACSVGFVFPDSIPLIALAILEILLRVAGLIAIIFVIYGGVTYVISQGEPDKVGQAKGTIINALIGLVVATFAVAIVSFVGNRIG